MEVSGSPVHFFQTTAWDESYTLTLHPFLCNNNCTILATEKSCMFIKVLQNGFKVIGGAPTVDTYYVHTFLKIKDL